MRIGFFGDGPWARRALQTIVEGGSAHISFICLRYGAPDQVLRRWADEHKVPVFVEPSVNNQAVIERFRSFFCDLFVSVSFDQILKAPIRQASRLGFINCHAGALPFYRGRSVLNWAIINGEDHFGVTVHFVDDGIDTGDIIVQHFATIGPDDTYADVLSVAYDVCAQAVGEAVALLATGQARRVPQNTIDPVGFYCTQRGPGDEWVQWSWSTWQIHNFIRALVPPGPGARCRAGDRTFALTRSRVPSQAPRYIGIPGAVVGRDNGVQIKTADTVIHILEVRDVGTDGSLGEPYVPSWKIGLRFAGAMTA